MRHILSTTALAAALALGSAGLVQAQTSQGSTPRPGMGSTSQSGGAGSTSAAMSEDQLRSTLRNRGYTDIEDMRRDGQLFRISEARRYGETVDDLRVDASTGQVRNEKRLSEDQVENMLDERGYYDVEDIERDGYSFTADAKQKVKLKVDGQTGMITRERSRDND